MATTNYAYRDYESLGDIANKFNTSTLNLVKLNQWLKDPNDGHTYMHPVKSPRYIEAIYTNGKFDHYEFHETLDEKQTYKEYRTLEMIVPIVANGSSSIEDYWENVNNITGISYNVLIDNIVNNTNAFSSTILANIDDDPDADFSTQGKPSQDNNDFLTDSTEIKEFDINNSANERVIGEPVLPNIIDLQGMSVYNLPSAGTNMYIREYMKDFSTKLINGDIGVADYTDTVIGNYLQNQINAGAGNASAYLASGLFNSKTVRYGGNDTTLFAKRNRQSGYYDKDGKWHQTSHRLLTDIYNGDYTDKFAMTSGRRGYTRGQNLYGSRRYGYLGNPYGNIKGEVTVTIDGYTLYMPCYPENITDRTNVNYDEQNALGRSEPYQAYNNSGPRSIPFTFKMHREMMDGDREEVEKIVRWIESAAYPNYDTNVAAVKVSVKVGKTIYISGIMTDQSTSWEGPIGDDQKYNMVTVSFTIKEVTGDPKKSETIRKIGGYRA